jgi:hypothetical protein
MLKLFSKRRVVLLTLLAFAVLLLFVPSGAHAGFGEIFVLGLGSLVQIAVEFLGKILIAVIDMLVLVAQYNDFGDSAAVNIGWVITRDLANMLFIVALIVISFGTVLQWEQYRYNRLLGKLVLTVVLVNFSKAISLLLIDFSQVIMMTFVNAFRDVAAGNLTTGFGIRALLAYADSSTSVDINLTSTVLVYALAVILILIALVVTVTLVVILLRRIISLWVIIILSPLAFISSIMPGGVGSYNSGWWKRLGQEMFVGPALAFFLWLSFSVIFLTSGQGAQETATVVKIDAEGKSVLEANNEVQATVSQIGSTQNLFNFIAVIVLLIHSMTIAQQAGGFAGKFASRASGWIDQGGSKLVKGIAGAPKKLSDVTGVTGVAKRAGFTLADKGLHGLESSKMLRSKVLGWTGFANRFGYARGRLNKRRLTQEDKDARDMQFVSSEVLESMSNGGANTETARSRKKASTEILMARGDGDRITAKGHRDYQKYIGYQESVDEKGKLKRNAVDQGAYVKYKSWLKENPHRWLDEDVQKGRTDPAVQRAAINKMRSDVEKLGEKGWIDLDTDALDPELSSPLTRRIIYDTFQKQKNPERLLQKMSMRNQECLDKTNTNFKGVPTATPDQYKKMGDVERVMYDQFIEESGVGARRTSFERERETRQRLGLGDNTSTLADMIKYADAKKSGLILSGSTFDQSAQDAVDERHTRGESYDEIAASLQEYEENPDKMSDEEYADELAAEQKKKASSGSKKKGKKSPLAGGEFETGEAPEFIAGRDVLARLADEKKRAAAQGRESSARFIADFDKLGLDGTKAGMNLTGEEKRRTSQELQNMFRQQLEQAGGLNAATIENRVQEFGKAIDEAENLAIVNSRQKGYTLGHVLRHENAHAEVDKLSDAEKEEMFGILDPAAQQRILDEVGQKWQTGNMPDKEKRAQAIEEYLTEGLANYGRSDAVGSELDEDLALAMKRKGVKFRNYSSTISASVPQGASRDELESLRRDQETKVNGLQAAYDARRAEISEELPPDVKPKDLTDTNPLVQQELSERGIPESLREEIQKFHEALAKEQRTLAEINASIQRQSIETEKSASETAQAIEEGMKSARGGQKQQGQPKEPAEKKKENQQPQPPKQPKPPESTGNTPNKPSKAASTSGATHAETPSQDEPDDTDNFVA